MRRCTSLTVRMIAGLLSGLLFAILAVPLVAQPATEVHPGQGIGPVYDAAHEVTLNGIIQQIVTKHTAGTPAGMHLLVTGPGGVEAVAGTPGGPTIPTTLAHVLMATLVHGQDPAEVLAASRLHHQGWPDVLAFEPGFDRPELLAALAGMGYPLKDKHELIADVQGVWRDGDQCLGVSDYRREGQALALA